MGSYICISLRPAQETQFSKQDQDKYIKPDSEGKKKKKISLSWRNQDLEKVQYHTARDTESYRG